MKKTAKAELRAKSAEDLKKEAQGLRDQMLKARFSTVLEGKTRGVKYREVRRQIARIETILGEKA